MAVFHRALVACMCLGFTGAGVAWADDAHPETPNDATAQWIENPYAPHHTNGTLFIDHISKLKRDRVIKKFIKAAKTAPKSKVEA